MELHRCNELLDKNSGASLEEKVNTFYKINKNNHIMLGHFEKLRNMILTAIQWTKYSNNVDELCCTKHH
jgi:hypothetical protein